MKLLYSFLKNTVVMLFVFAVFTQCKKSDDPSPSSGSGPQLSLWTGAAYTSENVTVDINKTIKVAWTATKGSANLSSFSVKRNGTNFSAYYYNDIDLYLSTIGGSTTYNDSISFKPATAAGTYTFVFQVKDTKGQTASQSITITVTDEVGATTNTYDWRMLGAQANSSNHFYSSSNNTTYSLINAKNNSSLIDFGYCYVNGNVTLASPADADLQSAYNDATNGISTWANKNQTLFYRTTLTTEQFNEAKGDEIEQLAQSANTSQQVFNSLDSGNCVAAFKTASGKFGLVRVSLTFTQDWGTISFYVKTKK